MINLIEATNRHLVQVETLLRKHCPAVVLLGTMSAHHLDSGGKRLRALIPPWIAANTDACVETACQLGVGLELLHNGTLVHDDLQDGDTHRRGQEAVWTRWGVEQAINLGNAFYFAGTRLIAQVCPGFSERVAAGLHRVVVGQCMEFQLKRHADDPRHIPTSMASWRLMAKAKTGALFGLSAAAGTVAQPMNDNAIAAWTDYGEAIGLLFQVQDDFLDLVGGKGRDFVGTDLAEGKLSFPVVWACEHASVAARERLREIVAEPRETTGGEAVQEALGLLKAEGALGATARWIVGEGERLQRHELARYMPGLVEAVVRPVAHALHCY